MTASSNLLSHLVQKASSCMPFHSKVSKVALNLMADHDICQRCMLRMVGVRDKSVHSTIESAVSIPSKRSIDDAKTACIACVGLLQMDYSAITADAMSILNQYDLKEKTFSLRMQFPPQLSVRKVAFRKFLEEKVNAESDCAEKLPDDVEIREIFRHLVAESFSNASGYKFDVNVIFMLIFRAPFL